MQYKINKTFLVWESQVKTSITNPSLRISKPSS